MIIAGATGQHLTPYRHTDHNKRELPWVSPTARAASVASAAAMAPIWSTKAPHAGRSLAKIRSCQPASKSCLWMCCRNNWGLPGVSCTHSMQTMTYHYTHTQLGNAQQLKQMFDQSVPPTGLFVTSWPASRCSCQPASTFANVSCRSRGLFCLGAWHIFVPCLLSVILL